MANKPIGLLVNRFEVASRNSFNVAAAIGAQHVSALHADSATVPIALICYNNVKPKYDAYLAARVAHLAQTGAQVGEVLTLQQLLDGMPANVESWQISIKAVYDAKTTRFKEMFSKGKSALNRGTQINRINAVESLLTAIGSDAALTAVKGKITLFHTSLLTALTTKDDAKSTTVTDSTTLETTRIDLCDEIEGNLGLLINNFKKDTSLAAKYFDETLLHNSLQMSFDLKIKPLNAKKGIKRTFINPLTQQFQIDNRSNTTLKAYLSLTKYGLPGLIFVTIPPESVGMYNLTDMGDNSSQKFLNIYNTDARIKGDVTVKVL
jgi:hypothetical protein